MGDVRTGLVLNSCFFGFYAHFGFARALERAGVSLDAFGGSSAGAVVAAAMASGLGAERGVELALGLRPRDFWDPDSLAGSVMRLGRVRGERFESILRERLPAARIEDCPRPLVVATTALPLLTPVLLGRGPLARAVRASCAVPLVLQPVRLEGRLLVDGGVVTEAPLRALVERHSLERVILHVAGWERPGGPPPLDPGLRRAIAWARARGVVVSLARTVYPRLEPDRLERAGEAVAAGERSAGRLLETVARPVA